MSLVTQTCTSVPITTGGSTTSSLYDCQGKAAALRTAASA
jgi:hypothetical protein